MQAMPLAPTAPDWESPFKRAKPNSPTNADLAPRKMLFGDDIEPTERTLTELYNFELDTPPVIDPQGQFFKVRELVSDIETILNAYDNTYQTTTWRGKVSQQLYEVSFDKKMAELGAILFYITKDGDNLDTLVDTPSLMEYRAQELRQEVESYLQSTQSVDAPSCIPSGKIHYLMRAFAHMVVTKNHVYNRGGLIAIRELLSNPQYLLTQYLQPEHRDHILVVIKELLSKPSTAAIFNGPVVIAESLKDLIRIDLKLDSTSPIDSTLILYDCLMALFADIRQFEYPNCYAVASFVYSVENHTNKTLHKMLEWLRTGYYSFQDKRNIPIRPLLNGRLASCRDFTVSVNTGFLFTFAPFEHIQSTLGLTTVTIEDKTQPLGKALEALLHDNGKKDQLSYATKLYNGFKYNALVDMQIALLEFENSNLMGEYEVREKLICACITASKRASSKLMTKQEIAKLGEALDARIWLQPCYEKKVRLHDGSIIIGSGEVIPSAGNTPLSDLLHESVRVFTLKDDAFHPVYSITDLRGILQGVMKELHIAGSINLKGFSNTMSQLCSETVSKKFPVSARTLKSHDLLVFSQDGGNGEVVLDHVYKISVSSQKIADATTPYQLLKKIFALFKAHSFNIAETSPKFLISTHNDNPYNHQWTVSAKCWKIFSAFTNFNSFAQQNIFNPADKRLDSYISQDVFINIILRYTKNQGEIDQLMDAYRNLQNPTYSKILNMLHDCVPSTWQSSIRDIVDEEFSKITINKKILTFVLNNLKLPVTTDIFEEIFNSLSHEKSPPFKLARDLRLALIRNKIAILDPQDVELEICKAANVPIPINIGDLNWTEVYSEDPVHTRLWIRYSYWDHTLGYFIRRMNTETRESNRNYCNVKIQHPKQVINK